MPFTDIIIRNAKPKEKVQALGIYPEISLKEVRDKIDGFRKYIKSGIDPIEEKRKEERQKILNNETLFSNVLKEWYQARMGSWTHSHAAKILRRFEIDVLPLLSNRLIKEIIAPELLSVKPPFYCPVLS